MRISIRYQFMLPLLAVAVASLLAVGVIYARLATRHTTARIEEQLRGVIGVLAESSYPLTDAVLRQMGALANAEFVLTDANGKQIASGSSVDGAGLAADDFTAKTVGDVALGPPITLGRHDYMHSSVWIERRPQLAQRSVLHILFAQVEFDEAWRAAFLPPFVVGAVTILAIAAVIHLVSGRVGRVLSRLGRELARLAEGDFTEAKLPAWNDETRDLALAVNQTAARLAQYEAELRRTERMRTVAMLGAGLAHEMRNAATGCRLAVDLHAEACRNGAEDDSLRVARRQLLLMENRLQQLLHLGKDQPAGASHQPASLATLISETVELIRPAANHAGVRLDWQEPQEEITVSAEPQLLEQAITNLLLNALDAAARSQAAGRRPGFVRVALRCDQDHAELVVEDSGDGPSERFAHDVFEPFVTSKPEGVGVGLAVARRVVEASGGQIGWERAGDLTRFTIQLPLAAGEVCHV